MATRSQRSTSPTPQYTCSEEYRDTVASQSYIGKKGYTIPKSVLDPADLKFLYKDLYMIPEKGGGAPFLGTGEQDAFPIYRENTKKIYLPRFYGIDRYGRPAYDEVAGVMPSPVETIRAPFVKQLRDYQIEVIDIFLKSIGHGKCSETRGGIIQFRAGGGKTVMCINILSQIAKKTLIIVHKEFLLNQWIERISEFCPKATIGRIQGPVFDVEGKDIVIGMLQTIYDRDFPENAFDTFGLTIVDEVHRIGSCQFSRALLRVQTPIMLGVTATLDRKDGLTRVIHQFMGPLVYNQASQAPIDRRDFEHVLVRGMEFVHSDPDFQEVATDFRGNVMFSTMITKLCSFGPRTRFLLRILRDLVQENPEAQILVLGHNRSLLVDLHEAVVDQEIATVGYYLGGMKQQDLDRTTERQIILATYAMASEGFDHKNLSILVMITPKTDIVQSVGRIFRTKHERPIIVDVIDCHDIFKNQWRKRLTYYRKCGYRIETIQSTDYHGFQNPGTKWTPVRRLGGGSAATTKSVKYSLQDSTERESETSGKCFIQINPAELAASDDS